MRLDFLIAGLASFLVCIFLIATQRWHGSLSMDRVLGVQKMHTKPTLRIGGIGIALGVIAGFAASSHDGAADEKRAILSSIIIAGIPAFMFGLLEDLTKQVTVRARLLATMASGLLGWGITGVSIQYTAIPGIDWLLEFTIIAVIFTAFAVGGIANSINMIDGFNGLAAGASLIMLTALGLIARGVDDIALAFTCLVLAGSILGFLVINWPLGKIFLGDGGAYFIGFCIAWIAVLLPYRNDSISPWTCLLVCFYPVLEVVASYLRRTKRTNHSPGQPDRVHLHHLVHRRLIRQFFKKASPSAKNALTSCVLWCYCAALAAWAIFTASTPIYTSYGFAFATAVYVLAYRKLCLGRFI